MSEDNFKAGAFYTDAFSLVNQYNETVDLRGLVINFQLFESIYKKFVTAEVSILDGMNLLKNFRLTSRALGFSDPSREHSTLFAQRDD